MSINTKINFTQAQIRDLPIPDKGRIDYRDIKNNKLICRVSSTGVKSFLVNSWHPIKRRSVSVTLGKFPDISAENARKQAAKAVLDISQGIDLNAQKKQVQASQIKLNDLFAYFKKHKSQILKPSTLADYEVKLKHQFKDWMDIPVTDITEGMIIDRYRNNKLASNAGIRTLKAVLNYAVKHGLIDKSPITNKLELRRENKRKRIIRRDQLKAWIGAVKSLNNDRATCYLMFSLYTGCRASEALNLAMQDIDIYQQTAIIRDTKNRTDHTIYLASDLMPYIDNIFDEKQRYLFQSDIANRPMQIPRAQIKKVIKLSGVTFTSHDLRRTFTTYAQACKIDYSIIKALLNHSVGADITLRYTNPEPETLRQAINQMAEYIASALGA